MARRRRRVDHRSRRAAGRARRIAAARVPPLDRGLGGHHPLGQEARHQRHRRGHPSPPAAHRRARARVRRALQGQSSAASGRGCARRARGPRRRHDRHRRHRPRAAPERAQGVRVAGRGERHGGTGERPARRAPVDGADRASRVVGHRTGDERKHRHGSGDWQVTARRSRSDSPPRSRSTTPRSTACSRKPTSTVGA